MKYTKKEIEEFLKESNAIEDVHDEKSLKQAKIAWKYLESEPVLNSHVILKTHKILMLHQKLWPNEKGYFRTVPVWVAGREGLKHDKIRDAINEWVIDIETSIQVPGEDGKHIKFDHVTYEKIHPFVDGNGRTGRMFMNWERMQADLPILIIHADWPNPKGEQVSYYSWFKQDDVDPEGMIDALMKLTKQVDK